MKEVPSKEDIHSEAFLHHMMQRQLRLSLVCASLFLISLLALPLLNYFFPDVMSRSIFGFPLNWFLLGILFFPIVWVIAWFFIRRSIAFENHAVTTIRGEK